MSHWLDDTDNWLEIFKRKLSPVHKDLYVYLDTVVENSSLEFIDVQGCALSAARAIGYPVFVAAIEKEMANAMEKQGAAIAASMASLNSTWVNYLAALEENHAFLDPQPAVITAYGGVSELKFNMYMLSANVAQGNNNEVKRLVNYLKEHLSQCQINDIVRIAAVITAAIKAQV